jgi:trans-aconitate methyltransferase
MGRLTRQLIPHFEDVIGVDISQKMLDLAKVRNPSIRFVRDNSLDFLGPQKIDLIMERIVLQHIEPKYAMNYMRGGISHLSDGGLFTFMMPPEESKQYAEYRDRAIKNRHDNPLMLMYSVPTKQVEDLIKERGGKLLEKEYTGGMFVSCVYWVTK